MRKYLDKRQGFMVRLGLTALALLLVASPVLAASEGPGGDDLATVEGRDTTVATGVVTRNGVPVKGAEVVVRVWPNDAALLQLEGGEVVHVQLLGTVVDSAGRFVLSVDPNTLGASYVEPDGSVHFDLMVGDAEGLIRWSFSASRNRSGAKGGHWANPRIPNLDLADRTRRGNGPVHLLIDIGDDAFVVEEGNEPANWVDDLNEPLGASRGMDSARVDRFERPKAEGSDHSGDMAMQMLGCGTVAQNEYLTGKDERFVWAIGWTHAPVTVTQTVGTKHTLGIAASLNGGAWKAGGTLSKTFQAEASTPYPGEAARVVGNKVNYRKFVTICPGVPTVIWDEWRPHNHHSLNAYASGTAIPHLWAVPSRCTTYSSGTYTKVAGTNKTYDTGVPLGILAVSAHAAFAQSTKLSWTFTQAGGWLCGSTSMGWVSAPEAGAFRKP